MPRRRRTPGGLGPQQDPRNLGQNRAASMRANNRTQNSFRGGLGQGPVAAPGIQPSGTSQPGRPQPGAPQPGATQCPAGQQPGPTPDGRMGCVPVGKPGMPGQGPQSRPRPGAGTPTRMPSKPYKEGY